MFGRELYLIKKGLEKILIFFLGDLVIGRNLRFYYFKKIIKKNIQKNDIILDAGCGQGQYSFYLSNKVKEIISVDYNPENIKLCKKINKTINKKNIKFKVENLINYKNKNKFNKIISFDVTHYVGDKDKEIFKNYYESLKENGILILTVPNKTERNKIYKQKYDKYSKKEIISLLKSNKFRDININPIGNGLFNKINSLSQEYSKNNNLNNKLILFILFLVSKIIIPFDKYRNKNKNATWLIIAKK